MESNQASLNKILPPTSLLNALMSFQNDAISNADIARVIFPLIYKMTPEEAQKLVKRNIEALHKAPEKIRDMLRKIESQGSQNDLNKSDKVTAAKLQKNGNMLDKSLEKYATGKLKDSSEKTLKEDAIKKHEFASSSQKESGSKNTSITNLFSLKNKSTKADIEQLKTLVLNIAKAKTYAEKENSLKKLVSMYFKGSIPEEIVNNNEAKAKALEIYGKISLGTISEQTPQAVIKSILLINAFFPVYLHHQNKIRLNRKKSNEKKIKAVLAKENSKDKKDQPK